MNLAVKFLFSGFLFLIACGVKQPVENADQSDVTGNIFVNSQPSGASIILDGTATGLVTPDTVKQVPVGNHVLRVFLDGYRAVQDSFVVTVKEAETAAILFELQKIITTVTLNIESDPAGAAIFVNDQNTGKVTPDTLIVEPGAHRITLVKNGFVVKDTLIASTEQEEVDVRLQLAIEQRVLFESFANVSCVPCVAATQNLLKFTHEHANSPYAIIEYFANWPSPNDPFYKVAPKDVDERVNFYGVQTLPTLKVKGTIGVDPNNYDEIVNKFNQSLLSQNTPLAISIEKQLVGAQLEVHVELFDYGNVLDNADLRLFVAIAEDSIHYDSPPGSNGIKDFEWVFRGFLTDRQGANLDNRAFTFSREWPANWQFAHSKIVAFVQNIKSKEILQTGIN
ncbi:PEGA domain protein [Caldithrix abyssi DSM 13497]|uniref:PEGA domain protein n=1 Tax=Caldithrix abyssi DSM 13497 TaxID=880073 RepID=H1XWG1_CALAY|nr:PEGA domain-containing protein [Caldithrix abyssi]APF20761.1 PEGA domain-containing protein [Caldithrix abyssi DSM 13497]EHO40743.1 PEGA domain protein [Caldithrix abyssi DSM 13497]